MAELEIIKIVTPPLKANSYLLNRRILIDVGGDALFLLKKIKEFTDPKEIRFVFLTHLHYDHAGAADLIRKLGCKILVHEDEFNFAEKIAHPLFSIVHPDIIIKNNDVFSFEDFDFRIFHTPGHSPGSICILEKEKGWLFTGDTVFYGGAFGRVDFPGGNINELVRSLERLCTLKNINKLFPGHDESVEKEAKMHIKMALFNAKKLLEIYKK